MTDLNLTITDREGDRLSTEESNSGHPEDLIFVECVGTHISREQGAWLTRKDIKALRKVLKAALDA